MEDLLKKIKEFDTQVIYRQTMYRRYTTESIPIQYEQNPNYLQADIDEKSKPDRRLYNHWEKEIVDTKVSYFIGHPIIVNTYDGNDDLNEVIDYFNVDINYEDLFAEVTKDTAISGVGGVMLYKDKEAKPQCMILNPAEFMVYYELKEPVSAIRKYTDKENVKTVEYFDTDYMYTYKQSKNGEWTKTDETLHGFGRVPIIEVYNNREKQSDYHSVCDLIDAYNRLISDLSNEIESFRLAYMVLENFDATKEDIAKIRQTGAIKTDKDGKVYFLTKSIDTKAVEVMREILEKNIAKFSGHVVFSTNDFTGNLTRIAVNYKLRPLENKTLNFERKFKTFLREFYRTYLSFKGFMKEYDYTDIVFIFSRNIPVNIVEEADLLVKLDGQVSDETRLGMMSFVDNPLDELRKLKEQGIDNNTPQEETNG